MTLRERKRLAAVYLRAAKLVASAGNEEFYSCCAVEIAAGHSLLSGEGWGYQTRLYQRAFGAGFDGYMSISQFHQGGDPRGLRVLALCFAAELALTGDL